MTVLDHLRYAAGRDDRGDTIVEVLIVISLISLMLVAGFKTTNESSVAVRDSQEHAEALYILRGQVERLRPLATGTSAAIYAPNKVFCIDSNGAVQTFTSYTSVPPIASDDWTNYPPACKYVNNLYNLSVTYDTSSRVFTFLARWDRISHDRDQVELFYRLPPPPPPLPQYTSCSDAGINSETYFFDFTITPFAADWKVWHHNGLLPPHPMSTVPYNLSPGIPAGTYDYWAVAGDDTSFNPLANNRELHYMFYDSSGSVITQTVDTPDFNINPAFSQPVMGALIVPTGKTISYIMVQHSSDQGGTDDALFAACLALRLAH
jgi:type II secretory pathway pseudopilin PulG